MTAAEPDTSQADDQRSPSACVFTPSPLFTVTVEAVNEEPEVHFHAGGQGVWVARMLVRLGVSTTLCGPFGGESGTILRMLIEREGVRVADVPVSGANGGYIHDRRGGERDVIVEVNGQELHRHEVDDLYNAVLSHSLAASLVVLTGPAPEPILPPEVYGRLAHDLGTNNGVTVVADLSRGPLQNIGDGVHVLKVSHEELIDAGFAAHDALPSIVGGARLLRSRTGQHVVVTRAEEPAIAVIDDRIYELVPPKFEPLDHHGAGDSLTAGTAAGLCLGMSIEDSLRLGVAAGALNVTRHGLATGRREYIDKIARHVGVVPRDDL